MLWHTLSTNKVISYFCRKKIERLKAVGADNEETVDSGPGAKRGFGDGDSLEIIRSLLEQPEHLLEPGGEQIQRRCDRSVRSEPVLTHHLAHGTGQWHGSEAFTSSSGTTQRKNR